MKKVLRGKYFADLEEKKQKMAEALKDVKIDMFRNFSAVESMGFCGSPSHIIPMLCLLYQTLGQQHF